MATSQNGYIANQIGRTTVYGIPGTNRRIRLRVGAPGALLVSFAAWFHRNIERIDEGQLDDWGYAERPIRGSTTTLSNHASGTAMDLNATKHPLGKRGTFTPAQASRIRAGLKHYGGCIRWGGDYKNRADEMHFEIAADVAACAAALARVTKTPPPTEKEDEDMPLTDADKRWIKATVEQAAEAAVSKYVGDVVKVSKDDPEYDPKNEKIRASTALHRIMDRQAEAGKAAGQ